MKKILSAFFVFALFLLFIAYRNSSPKAIVSELIKKGDIKPGNLKYKIDLLGILPAGEAVIESEKIEEYNGKKAYHLKATARNLNFFSGFFKGSAVLDSYVEPQHLNPLFFRQKLIIPGKPNINREVLYDQDKGIMSIAGIKRQIFANTQDPLSLLFNLRHTDFKERKEFEFSINTNQKNYILKGIAQPKDIRIKNKTYKTVFLKADIQRRDKNPYHQSSITIVMLRGKENIPILVRVFAGGFLINARLADIK